MATSSTNRNTDPATTSELYVAGGTLTSFTPVGKPSAAGAVSAVSSGVPYGYSTTTDTILATEQVVIAVDGPAMVVAGGAIDPGDSLVPTAGGKMIKASGSGAISNCRAVNDGTGLGGWVDGDFVPVIIGTPGVVVP